jgi:hypothetical protein
VPLSGGSTRAFIREALKQTLSGLAWLFACPPYPSYGPIQSKSARYLGISQWRTVDGGVQGDRVDGNEPSSTQQSHVTTGLSSLAAMHQGGRNGRRVSPSRAPVPQRPPYTRRRPSLPVAEQGGASRQRREPRVGSICWRCYGQNTQSSVILAHADRLQEDGLPEFAPRAAVDSRSFDCPCTDHGLRVKRACRALASAE